jgi:hypothetical protein
MFLIFFNNKILRAQKSSVLAFHHCDKAKKTEINQPKCKKDLIWLTVSVHGWMALCFGACDDGRECMLSKAAPSHGDPEEKRERKRLAVSITSSKACPVSLLPGTRPHLLKGLPSPVVSQTVQACNT